MPKHNKASVAAHLLTTEPTLQQHREEKRTLKGAFKAPRQEYVKGVHVDDSANNIGSKDVSSVAARKANAAIKADKEASAWLKAHQWGLRFA